MSQFVRLIAASLVASTVIVSTAGPDRASAAPPVPASTIGVGTATPLIGEDVDFVVTFDNADTTAAGYGPYVDLTFDSGGADGDDGVSFTNASYLGAPLTPLANFACTGVARTHPLTGLSIACPSGKQIVVIQLPFGSFTPGQPIADIAVVGAVSNLADVGFALGVTATPGFAYGDTATGSTPIIGSTAGASLTPEVVRFVKTYVGPEEETATGPNFPRGYTLDVDIATGQTVAGLTITDRLPPEYAYLSSVAAPAIGTTSPEPAVGVPSGAPDNVLSHQFTGNTLGTGAAIDASLEMSYFIPRDDAAAAVILDPGSGDDVTTLNDGQASGTVDPLDPRDANIPFTINSGTVAAGNSDDAEVIAKSIAVQKSVTTVVEAGDVGPTPGDTLRYTIRGQVSDYFTFADIAVDDILGDGQTFNAGYTPTLSISERGTTTSVNLATFYTVDTSARTTCGNGTTAIRFRVSDADNANAAGDGILTGGRVGTPAAGTTFEITFEASIDDAYTCSPPDTEALDPNDIVDNDVTVTGEVYDNATQLPQTTPRFEADTSATSLVIAPIAIEKSIWARNGTVGSFVTSPVQFAAGDLITYRLKLHLPSSDFSDLLVADYLPLPILTATALTKQVADCTVSTAPGLDQWCYGPADTLHTAPGFLPPDGPSGPRVDALANSITWDFKTQEFSDNVARDIELLFTLQIADDPFLDGLFLTNQVQASEENSFNTSETTPAIIQIELTEPELNIRKGAVAASAQTPAVVFSGPRNPTGVSFDAVTTAGTCPDFGGTISSNGIAGGAPDANVSGIDRDDLVRFAIVVENTGSGRNGAFDVQVSDVIPAGFELPAGGPDLCVTNGAGVALPHTATGFLDGAASSSGTVALTDGPTAGALAAVDPASGANIAVITYLLQVVDTIGANTPASQLTNTATIDYFSATEGGPSFLPVTPAGDLTDNATAATKPLTIAKARTNTSQTSTTGSSIAIGEEVEYTVTVTVPEGVARNVTLVDTLDPGLEISRPPTAAVLGSDLAATSVTGPTVSGDRRTLTYGFGDITNANSDNTTTTNERITFTYWAVVTNVVGNQRGNVRRNSAAVRYQRGSTGTTTSTHTARTPVTIVEPTLDVAKSASSPTIDADDTLTYTIVVDHDPSSNADAFEITLTDVIPAGLIFQIGTLAATGTPTTTLAFDGIDTITATWSTFPQGSSTTITFDVAVDPGYDVVSSITNTASIAYTGLPGSPTTSLGNTDGVERTGAGGVDDYTATGSVVVQPIAPTISKALVETDQASTTSPNVTIGETVTYDLTVTLPEGNINGFTVTDQLPAGMRYVAGTVEVFTAAGAEVPSSGLAQPFAGSLGASAVTGGTTDGEDLVVTFGATTVTPDTNDTNNSIVVRLDALVLDVASNVGVNPGQTTLDNRGVVQLDGSSAVDSAIVGTPVIEPGMLISKSFDPTTASQGDTVTVNLEVENTGLGTAHDVVIDDVLDAFFDESTAVEGVTPAGFVYSRTGGTIVYTGGPIPAGATVDFSFTVQLDAVVPIGTSIPNTARVTQATTLPGTVAGERDEPDTTGSAVLNSVGPDLTLSKDDGVTTITPGAQTTYDLVVTNVGGFQATGVHIDDTLPPGTTFVGVGGTGCSDGGAVSGARRILIAGAIPANGGTITCTMTIEMTAPAAAGTSGYLNQAVVADDGVNGPDPTPGNNLAMDNDTISGRSPDVRVTKSDGVTVLSAGARTTYTIEVTNIGNIGVTNVLVTDTLPPGLSFNACRSLSGTVSIGCSESAGIVTITYASLAGGGGSASFEIVADVDDPIPAGIESVDNRVTAIDDGTNGTDPDPTNNTDNDVDTISAQPDMVITKTHTQANVAPGGTVDYRLTVSNVGDQNATGVIVTDTVDPQMTVVCASVSPAATTCNTATGVITWGPGLEDDTSAIAGGFVAGESVTLRYSTVADDPLLAGTTRFDNTATVTDDDGTANGDPTPADNTDSDAVPLASNAPELGIVKDDAVTDVVPGQLTTYTLTVTNNGNIGATGVVVTDTLPAELEFVSCSDGCDSTALPRVTWSIGSLAGGGATTSVTITARVVDPVAAGVESITNPASVVDDGANGTDPIPGNNDDDDIDIVDATPDLAVSKDDGATQRAAGETFDYTIVVANNGDQAATGVTVVDTLPAILTADSCPATPVPCTIDNTAGTVTWSVGDLNGGADQLPAVIGSSVTLTVTVTVDDTVASGVTSFTNSVRVADDGTNSGGTPIDDTDDDTDLLDATPDMLVTKDDGVTNVSPGDTLVYDIIVTNVGSQSATGVAVTDTLPPGVAFVSCTPTCDSTGLPTLVWSNVVEDLPGTPVDPGAFDAMGQTTLTVTVTVDTPAVAGLEDLDNVVTVVDDGANGADPTPGNNVDNDLDVLDATPDLVVSKSDGVSSVADGQTLDYDITFTNAGNQVATGVVITDVLPDEVSFVTCTDACDPTGDPTIVWNVGALAPGAGGTFTVTVVVDDPVDPSTRHVINNVSITDDGANGVDPTPGNNRDTDDDTYGIDLAVAKTDGRTTVIPGEDVTYTVTVTNNGPTTIQDFRLTETLPAALNDVTFTPSAGVYNSGTGLWNGFGDFDEGESLTLEISGRVDPAATGSLTNTARVTAPDFVTDSDPTNDAAVDVDTLDPHSDLVISKQLTTDLIVGESARYDISVRNDGPSVAVGVRVVDVLPSGLTFQSVIAPGWTCANAPARTITCTLDGPLPVDDSASLTLVVGVNAPGGTVITNTATVSSAGVLGVGSRPTDADTGTVSAAPDPNVPLPRTGTEVLRIVLTAFALVILGAALLIGKRRRTPMTPST